MSAVTAVVVAAGEGRRFGAPKQFVALSGKAVLDWSLRAFSAHPRIASIVLVLPDEERGASYRRAYPEIKAAVQGGPRRQDSVANGVRVIDGGPDDIVLVHDGARPLIDAELISRVIEEAERSGAAVPVIGLDDTVKEVADGRVIRTLDRSSLVRVQTPQGFGLALLRRALEAATASGFEGTDEASLVERLGERVAIVAGDARNIKITEPGDLAWAEITLNDKMRPWV
jgi:2-C-methyl-D-erythritol 4-phosphate cytidylyltransferase